MRTHYPLTQFDDPGYDPPELDEDGHSPDPNEDRAALDAAIDAYDAGWLDD